MMQIKRIDMKDHWGKELSEKAAWQIEGALVQPVNSAKIWSMALLEGGEAGDARIEFTLVIPQPARERNVPAMTNTNDEYHDRQYYVSTGDCQRDRFGEDDYGYEAAAVLRYRAPDEFYRVQFSCLWQEVALWKHSGGFVAVAPAELRPGTSHAVAITARGDQIIVEVDKKVVLQHRDRRLVIKRGRWGLAVYEGKATFGDVCLKEVSAEKASVLPAHKADFSIRQWRHYPWIFDGREPVAVIRDNICIEAAKLRPGYHYQWGDKFLARLYPGYPDLYRWKVANMGGNPDAPWDEITSKAERWLWPGKVNYVPSYPPEPMEVLEDSADRIVLKLVSRNFCDMLSTYQIELTYDAAGDSYVYHVKGEADLRPALGQPYVIGFFEFADPYIMNAPAPATVLEPPWKGTFREAVFDGPDGVLYHAPLNHFFHVEQRSEPRVASSGRYMAMGDPVSVPCWTYALEGVDFASIHICHWAWDVHMRRINYLDLRKASAEEARLRIAYRIAALEPREADKIRSQAEVWPAYDPANPKLEPGAAAKSLFGQDQQPYAHEMGLSPTGAQMDKKKLHNIPQTIYAAIETGINRFATLQSTNDATSAMVWTGSYGIDRKVGHGDTMSLRLEGSGQIITGIFGPSNFQESFLAQRYLATVWVKTEGVKGRGPALEVAGRNKLPIRKAAILSGMTGTGDWRQIGLVVHFPQGELGIMVRMWLEGTGTAWFDDFEWRALKPDEDAQGFEVV